MKKIKKKILIVTSEFPPLPGGIGNHAYNLALNLNTHGYDVKVIADERDSGNEELEFDNKLLYPVYRIRLRSWRVSMYLLRIISLFKLIKNVDVVMASGKFSLWSVAFASLFYKRHYIAIIHGSEVNFTNSILKRSINASLKKFSSIIAVSKYTKSLVSSLKLHSIRVIPNGFDPSDLSGNWNQQVDLKGSPKLITVGNVTQRKGQLNVINHLNVALKKYPELHYHCVGFPTEKEVFLNEAKRLKVADHITFHGRVKHEELYVFLKNSDVFVMLSSPTSSGDVEGFGIAILEANHLGLAAIGSLGCGIEDAIDNNKSGILVEHNDSKQFIEAIQNILENKARFSKDAKMWSAKHSWEIVIKSYIDEIEQP